jgi:hypothetical protein
LNGETNRATQRQNSAIIVADVRRFAHVINTDGVFATHTTLASVLARGGAGIRFNEHDQIEGVHKNGLIVAAVADAVEGRDPISVA